MVRKSSDLGVLLQRRRNETILVFGLLRPPGCAFRHDAVRWSASVASCGNVLYAGCLLGASNGLDEIDGLVE